MSKTVLSRALSTASIEQLRLILKERSGTQVPFEEAQEIGIQLLSLYECLARERGDSNVRRDEPAR